MQSGMENWFTKSTVVVEIVNKFNICTFDMVREWDRRNSLGRNGLNELYDGQPRTVKKFNICTFDMVREWDRRNSLGRNGLNKLYDSQPRPVNKFNIFTLR